LSPGDEENLSNISQMIEQLKRVIKLKPPEYKSGTLSFELAFPEIITLFLFLYYHHTFFSSPLPISFPAESPSPVPPLM
jgi:hypothetical protein